MVDADLKSYFDTLPHERLLQRLGEKVTDGRLLRLVASFLKADILEELREWTPAAGAPQGAVLTPPTILRTAPFEALVKRVGVHLVDHADRFLTHFDLFDQGTKYRPTRVPICVTQAVAHTLRERFQLLYRGREVRCLRLAFRRCLCFAFQPRQSLTSFTDAWLKFVFLQ